MNLKSCFKPICKQIFRTLIQLTVGVPKSMFARTRCTTFFPFRRASFEGHLLPAFTNVH